MPFFLCFFLFFVQKTIFKTPVHCSSLSSFSFLFFIGVCHQFATDNMKHKKEKEEQTSKTNSSIE